MQPEDHAAQLGALGIGVRAAGQRGQSTSGINVAALKRSSVPTADASKFDPLLPVEILRLARERGGLLTVSNVSLGHCTKRLGNCGEPTQSCSSESSTV